MNHINIDEFIPPNNYQFRRDFTNTHLVDKLNLSERKQLEEILLGRLEKEERMDYLIAETLSYLKSIRAVPFLMTELETCENYVFEVILSALIFQINKDPRMTRIALASFLKVEGNYNLKFLFYFLKKFDDEEINKAIAAFNDHEEFLVAYNSKQALKILQTSKES